jgi:hypothetical protein
MIPRVGVSAVVSCGGVWCWEAPGGEVGTAGAKDPKVESRTGLGELLQEWQLISDGRYSPTTRSPVTMQ